MKDWEKVYIDNEKGIQFPILVANIGTGVSFIVVRENGFERVGGTPIGGGTYTGLCEALIGESDYAELIKLTDQGNEKNVDLMLEDFTYKKSDAFGTKTDFQYSNIKTSPSRRPSFDEQQVPQQPVRKNTSTSWDNYMMTKDQTTDKNCFENIESDNVTFVS